MCMAMLLLEVHTQQHCNHCNTTSNTMLSNSHNPTPGATTNMPASTEWITLLSWHTINNQQKLQNRIGNVQECNQTYVKLVQQCPFTHHKVRVIYKQCFLPTVTYPLLATSIPPDKLYKEQRTSTAIFISKMGYPQSFPLAITFAMSNKGSIGLWHLGNKQSVQKLLQLLKHLQTNMSNGNVYKITIQTNQLMSGILKPILEDTCSIPWSTTLWIDKVQNYLRLINGQIILDNPWHQKPWCQYDHFIMEDVLGLWLTHKQNTQIQSIQTYLQVTLLSEITSHSRTHMLTQKIYWPVKSSPVPRHNQNHSNLKWPQQPCPGPAAWQQWREILTWLYLLPNMHKLQEILGPWYPNRAMDYHWGWQRICPAQEHYSNTTKVNGKHTFP